jgi:hypothetical protein
MDDAHIITRPTRVETAEKDGSLDPVASAAPTAAMARTSDPSASQRQLDDRSFWPALLSGLRALSNANFWGATRQLEALIGDMSGVFGHAPNDASLQWDQSDRTAFMQAVTAADADHVLTQDDNFRHATDYLLHWYDETANVYQRCREIEGIPAQAPTMAEQEFVRLIAHLRQHGVSLPSAVTWRKISIVLPAYNEELIIRRTTRACLDAASAYCPNVEIIIVDDGSRDRTGIIADEMASETSSVVAIHNRPNRGYGGALRSGFVAAKGDYVVVMDSDGQFDPQELRTLLEGVGTHPGAAVIGYRRTRSEGWKRQLNAWGWKQATKAAVGLQGIRDIDCAFKLLPTEAVRRCDLTAEGATISAELLLKLRRMGIPIVQLPVTHLRRELGKPTGANIRVIVRAFKELASLRRKLNHWEPAVGEISVLSAPSGTSQVLPRLGMAADSATAVAESPAPLQSVPQADDGFHKEEAFLRVPVWVLILISFAFIAAFQWLPFGWNIGPRVDGWTLLSDVDRGMRPYIYIAPDLITRPFFFWVWIFNYKLDPNNFVLLNLILMSMAIVRSITLYVILRRILPQQPLFAYLSAALLLVFPADSGTYYEGATHVLLSFTLQLVAIYLLICYWQERHGWQLALALLLNIISMGNYEIGALIFIATPIILWYFDRRMSLRLLLVSLVWWIAPGASLLVSIGDLFFNSASHHSTMVDTAGVPYTQKLANALQAQYWSAYESGLAQIFHGLVGGTGKTLLASALAIVVVSAAVATWRWRRFLGSMRGDAMPSVRLWLVISLGGFCAMLLGVALFFASDQLDSFAQYQPFRLFYFSAPGAVLSVAALIFALDRLLKLRQILATVLVVCMIACGSMSLLTQHQVWRNYSWKQQHLVGEIVRQTGHINDGTLVVVIDQSHGALSSYFPYNYEFEAAVQLIEENYSIHARLCYDNATATADTFYCHFLSDGIQIPDIWVGGQPLTTPYNSVIGFVLSSDGSLTMLHAFPTQETQANGYDPGARFDTTKGLPPRYYSMLTNPR